MIGTLILANPSWRQSRRGPATTCTSRSRSIRCGSGLAGWWKKLKSGNELYSFRTSCEPTRSSKAARALHKLSPWLPAAELPERGSSCRGRYQSGPADRRRRETVSGRSILPSLHGGNPAPRLADRKEDLPLLQRHFIARFATPYGKDVRGLTHRAQIRLSSYLPIRAGSPVSKF
jgi:hypothetical protein